MRGSRWLSAGIALSLWAAAPRAFAETPPAGAKPPSLAPQPAPAAAASAAPAPAAARVATVVFQADDFDAVLESDWTPDGKTSPWYAVCRAPCTEKVHADARFRAAGPGLHESTPFVLPSGRDRYVITGEMAGTSVAAPVAMIVAGNGLFWVVGPIFLVTGVVAEASNRSGGGLIATGAVVMLGGAVVGIAGVVMLIIRAQNKESKVTIAQRQSPRLELGHGLGLDARGLSF